ncbi:MAG: iduronate sulfatase, partial [Flavobacteriaceae bacterium]|nr:iduronate sulfatase [Flavobacteriaceae bacterium]
MNSRKLIVLSLVLVFLSFKTTRENEEKTSISKKKNILFIMVDDLRPELNIYGENKIISPHIDALA